MHMNTIDIYVCSYHAISSILSDLTDKQRTFLYRDEQWNMIHNRVEFTIPTLSKLRIYIRVYA